MVLLGAVQWRKFFFHSPVFLCNKHSNCTSSGGLGKLQDEGFQPWEPSCGFGHFTRSLWVTGGSGLWSGVSQARYCLLLPSLSSSHPSAQLVAQLRDFTRGQLSASELLLLIKRQDLIPASEKQPSLQLSYSNVNSWWPWSFTKRCAVTEPWTGESLLPMGCNNKYKTDVSGQPVQGAKL